MANVFKVKRSETPSAVPANSAIQFAELAINIADRKIYTKDSSNNIVELAPSGASSNAANYWQYYYYI